MTHLAARNVTHQNSITEADTIWLLSDSESEEADCPTDPPSRPGSTPSSGTALHQAPNLAGSPLVGQQQQQVQSSGDGPAAQRQLLYEQGFCRDFQAEAARKEYLERTGKGIVREPAPVKPEEAEPTDADIAELQAQLLDNPRLQRLLSSGEGSSQHQWQMRVYQAMLKQQEELLRQAHHRQQQQDLMVISDSEEEEEEEGEEEKQEAASPPAKKQRIIPQPAPAAATPTPGSGAAGARAGSNQAVAAQLLRQGMAASSSGRLSKSTQPVSNSELPQQQQPQQQPRRPPVSRAPRQRQQQQPTAAPNHATAAAAAGGAGDDGDGGTFAKREAQRALRARLTQLEATAVSKRQEMLDSDGGKLISMLRGLDALGQKTERAREAAQHAGVMATCIKSGVEMIQAFSTSRRGRDPGHLVSALRSSFALDRGAALGSQEERPVRINWGAIGTASSHLFRAVPGVSSMQGALAATAKAPRQVVRRQRAVLEAEVRPAVGAEVTDPTGLGQATDQLVKEMRTQLQAVGRANVVALVLDHDSFAHTLENVFALSFLCKDMYAGLEEDEAEGLVARHISAEQRKQLLRAAGGGVAGSGSGQQGGRLVPRQFMMELDMSTWADMKAVMGRADTLMPQRPRAQH